MQQKMLNGLVKLVGGGSNDLGLNLSTGSLFLYALLLLALRSVLVMLTYNMVAPKIIQNTRSDVGEFRPITFLESVLFVILVSNLIGRS